MKSKHTPTPWHHNEDLSLHETQLIYGPDGYLVADCGRIQRRTKEETSQNAAFIVRAVNAHDDLVDALESFPDLHNGRVSETDLLEAARDWFWGVAQPALAKARGDDAK